MGPVALIYPPTCDPTAPYLSVPTLTAALRTRGVRVLPIDANVEAFDRLLRRAPLEALRDRVLGRLAELEAKPSLGHADQRLYATLWAARGDAEWAPGAVEGAVADLRDPVAFFDPARYERATRTIEAALRVISAAYAPLELTFTAYRTPFSLLTPGEIERDAGPERNPFYDYARELGASLREAGVRVAGLSVVFPGQVQPAFSLAFALREVLGPDVHLTVGGPAITQLLLRIKDDAAALARALGPFDSAVCYEGETALFRLVEALAAGRGATGLPNVIAKGHTLCAGGTLEDLRTLPPPDFDGLPLDKYLSPALVLPYDPTRGCYWGVCTFCHYGLAEKGTAPYKERDVATAIGHLRGLAEKHQTRYFYLSQDSVAPKTLLKLADALAESNAGLRWATDLKPEKYLTAERAERLKRGGALACALGVESASPRVLKLINKGAPVSVVTDVIERLHAAGIGVEAMCFTDFPTETAREARATLEYLRAQRENVSLFILGQFDLTPGSLIAQRPAEFGLRETFRVEGDEFGVGLFYEEARPSKRAGDAEKLEGEIAELSDQWLLRRYPWAGSLSTAHTLFWYDRFGPGVFRELAGGPPAAELAPESRARARFDLTRLASESARAEAEIWHELVYVRRAVSRELYDELAAARPHVQPAPRAFRYAPGRAPRPDGRRPRHAPNQATLRRPSWS
ncbi:MAG: radical SAM protein [Polyangiaceae bacterium]|jgi:hypothetical protein|nr:radical SAM protein [Polyangiaceae bacterium]